MRKSLPVILLFCCYISFAQKQNNTWCFGDKAGIDFNSGTPIPFISAITTQEENNSSVSDRNTGALLFYTDGMSVWDKNHTVMPNGTGIGNDPNRSTLQGSLIVPVTNDNNKYYIFSLEPESVSEGALYYTIVNMTLRGGLGDVVSTSKKIKLGKGFVEGMVAAPTCDGHWLLLSSKTINEFHAYRISANGIDTQAVISKMTQPYITKVLGAIKISPDNKKLLYGTYSSLTIAGKAYATATIHDFDEKTGSVTNGQLLLPASTSSSFYSVEFSSDGSKAYVCDLSSGQGLLQFNLALPTITDISASKKLVYQNPAFPLIRAATWLEMGPDSNIYVSIAGTNVIDRISNTNADFPGCVYTQNAIQLATGSKVSRTLPPKVTFANPKSLDTIYSSKDVTICKGNNTEFKGLPGALEYLWQDSSNQASFIANDKGTFWVKSNFTCYQAIDTFKVSALNLSVNLGKDTTICAGQPLTVKVNLKNDSTNYVWFNGNTTDSFVIGREGQFSVIVNSGPCELKDTINVKVNDSAYFYLGDDTILCLGETHKLFVTKDMDSLKWSTGAVDSVITVKQAGSYFLRAKLGRCSYTDTIDIDYAESRFNVGNDTTVCNGIELVLGDTSIITNSAYSWSSGEKGDTLKITKSGTYIFTVDNRCGTFYDTAVIDVKVCDCNPFIPTAFTPNNDGRNDKMGPVMRCINFENYEFIIINRFGQVMFRSTEPKTKWDGTFNGQPCDVGSYYYMMKIKNTSGTDEFHKGDVILMR